MANRPDTLAYGAFAVAEDGALYAGNNTNAAVEQAKQATLAQEITDRAADTATCLRSSAQTLTGEQQTQARTNIGAASAASAASAADLTTETNERITADTGVRGLTATVEATSTASQAYAIGAYFVYNGLLYKCTVAIAKGGTITPGTNCTATTAGAEISTLNQNLAGATGTFTAANSQITVDTGVDWHKITLIQTTSGSAFARLAILTTDFGWANIAGTGYYEPTYAAAKSGNSAIIPAVVFAGWLGTAGTVRWLAE